MVDATGLCPVIPGGLNSEVAEQRGMNTGKYSLKPNLAVNLQSLTVNYRVFPGSWSAVRAL